MKRIVPIIATLAPSGCAVSQQSEVQMEQQYAAQIAQQLPLVSDPEVARYINVLGDSIVELAVLTTDTKNFHTFQDPLKALPHVQPPKR